MSKKIILLFFQIILIATTLGCTNSNFNDSNTIEVTPSDAYLTIGVIGTSPEVNEKNITFKPYSLEQLDENIDPTLDALFVMPEHLEEAAEPEFAQLYRRLPYPTFFIGSEKLAYAFTEEDVTYETAFTGDKLMYTRGVFFNPDSETYQGWEFGLYNDVRNEKNIKAMYTQVFETISNLSFYTKNVITGDQILNQKEDQYLVYFYLPNCSHCAEFKPTLEKYEHQNNSLMLYKVDLSKEGEYKTWEEYSIKGTPTIFHIKKMDNGELKIINELVGVRELEEIPIKE